MVVSASRAVRGGSLTDRQKAKDDAQFIYAVKSNEHVALARTLLKRPKLLPLNDVAKACLHSWDDRHDARDTHATCRLGGPKYHRTPFNEFLAKFIY